VSITFYFIQICGGKDGRMFGPGRKIKIKIKLLQITEVEIKKSTKA
jgi:hypothetical protein